MRNYSQPAPCGVVGRPYAAGGQESRARAHVLEVHARTGAIVCYRGFAVKREDSTAYPLSENAVSESQHEGVSNFIRP